MKILGPERLAELARRAVEAEREEDEPKRVQAPSVPFSLPGGNGSLPDDYCEYESETPPHGAVIFRRADGTEIFRCSKEAADYFMRKS